MVVVVWGGREVDAGILHGKVRWVWQWWNLSALITPGGTTEMYMSVGQPLGKNIYISTGALQFHSPHTEV